MKKAKQKLIKDKDTLKFFIGRDDLSITIYMPVDCDNNCKFCSSKKDYFLLPGNLSNVLKSIKSLRGSNVNSYVITGGEPFADLNVLQRILDTIDDTKPVYVNTTLPTNRYSEDELVTFINNSRIDSINLSRHCTTIEKDKAMFSEHIASDEIVGRIKRLVKINSFVSTGSTVKDIIDRWDLYDNVVVSFRGDFRTTTLGDVKKLNDDISLAMLSIPGVEYVRHSGCDVCFNIHFAYKGKLFFYHKSIEMSSIQFGNNVIINDIIIKQDGTISYDWDGKNKGLKELVLTLFL